MKLRSAPRTPDVDPHRHRTRLVDLACTDAPAARGANHRTVARPPPTQSVLVSLVAADRYTTRRTRLALTFVCTRVGVDTPPTRYRSGDGGAAPCRRRGEGSCSLARNPQLRCRQADHISSAALLSGALVGGLGGGPGPIGCLASRHRGEVHRAASPPLVPLRGLRGLLARGRFATPRARGAVVRDAVLLANRARDHFPRSIAIAFPGAQAVGCPPKS